MKKISTLFYVFRLSFFIFLAVQATAQTDSVSLSAGYAQQVWYNLQTGAKATSLANNWDLAFYLHSREASIFINPVNNLHLYLTKTTTSNWATVDTAGILTREQFNADTSWSWGAFNRTGDGFFNYGWGNYVQATHNVNANNVYVIQLSDGSLKKFIVDKLSYDTTFTFRQANLDGTNEQKFTFNKLNFTGKTFGYFSFLTNGYVDREPKSSDWDLTFLRYTGLTPDPNSGVLTNYLLTGVLQHPDATVAKIIRKDTANNSFGSVPFSSKINTIGYDWKTYSMTANQYTVSDSTTYFIKRGDGKIYKLIFKKFGGSATGDIVFSKQLLLASSTVETDNGKSIRLSVASNPVIGNEVTLVIDSDEAMNNIEVRFFSIAGAVVSNQKINLSQGLQAYTFPINDLNAGFHFAQLNLGNKTLTEKFVIEK